MKNTYIRISLLTGLAAASVISIYSGILRGLALLNISEQVVFVFGVISIVVMPLAMYFGLRRLRYFRSRPLQWFESIAVGMVMALTTAVALVIMQVILTLLCISDYPSLKAYYGSGAPFNTLSWYFGLGLIYSVVLHVIIHFQFKNHEH